MAFKDEYSKYDAIGLSALIKEGEVSSVEAVEAAIAQIEEHNSSLNAVVVKTFEQALVDAGKGLPASPISGVPFLVKDNNLFVKGQQTSFSCSYFRDTLPAKEDSNIVGAWKNAGLIFLGKTNLPELAHTYVTEPTWRKATRNPWNTDYTPGGSSGGSAAAVASGMVPVAHANDAGGSIRVPASCTGLFGLKPTAAFATEGPHFPDIWGGLNAEHVLTKTVRDSAVFLDIELSTRRDLSTRKLLSQSRHPHLEALNSNPGKLKIGLNTTSPDGFPIDPECVAVTLAAARLLQDMGHEIVETKLPDGIAIGGEQILLVSASIAAIIEREKIQKGRAPEETELEEATKAFLELAANASSVDLEIARLARNDVIGIMAD